MANKATPYKIAKAVAFLMQKFEYSAFYDSDRYMRRQMADSKRVKDQYGLTYDEIYQIVQWVIRGKTSKCPWQVGLLVNEGSIRRYRAVHEGEGVRAEADSFPESGRVAEHEEEVMQWRRRRAR